MSKLSLSVVIPNFNGRDLLERHLPSVFNALQLSLLQHEVIVADDSSSDESVSFLKARFPSVVIVEGQATKGFSANINRGFRKAKNDLVLALNNDASLAPNYFHSLLKYFSEPETFGVMGALWDRELSRLADSAKVCEQSWLGIFRSTKNLMIVDKNALLTFFLSGANALMDRKKLEQIGFFDEIFSPFYNEDVDLGLRAWRMGWKCYFEPEAKAYHSASSTIAKHNTPKKIRTISLRNRLILHDIHLSSTKRFLFFSKLTWDCLTRWMIGDFTYYRAIVDFWRLKDKVNKSRRNFEDKKPVFSTQEVVSFLKKQQRNPQMKTF